MNVNNWLTIHLPLIGYVDIECPLTSCNSQNVWTQFICHIIYSNQICNNPKRGTKGGTTASEWRSSSRLITVIFHFTSKIIRWLLYIYLRVTGQSAEGLEREILISITYEVKRIMHSGHVTYLLYLCCELKLQTYTASHSAVWNFYRTLIENFL